MPQLIPPPHLYKEIMDEIQYRRVAAILRRKIFALLFGVAASFSAFLVLLDDFSRQIQQSSFTDLSRLMLSDFGVIKIHLYDYLLSLAEALPIVSMALLALALLLIILATISLTASAWELKKLKIH